MSKIARYAGNLRAFGSNAQGLERTIFGGTAQADDLTSQITDAFLRGWGIVGPSENPSMEDFNASMYTLSQLIAYQHQMGVPEWNANQEYYLGSICVRNGETYSSLVDSNNNSEPPSAKWTKVVTVKNGLSSLGLADTNGYVGRLLGVQVFTASGTYTPKAGAKNIIVEVLGGGGGGGSNANTSGNSSSASAAGGGGGGSYAKALLSAQNYTVIVGTGGTGGATTTGSSGNAGGAGGDSSIGSIIAYGGLGGSAGISIASLPSAGNTSGYAAMPAGNLIVGYRGEIGIRPIMYSSTAAVSGGGGRSMYSSGADGRYAQPVAGGYSVAGYDAFGYGGGGSGSASLGGSGGVSAKGGNGMSGIVIIWEYA